MTALRFKVGDRVRKIGRVPSDVEEGTLGTVKAFGIAWPYQVEFDGDDFYSLIGEKELAPADDLWPIPVPQAEVERDRAIEVAAGAIFAEDEYEIATAIVDALIEAGIIFKEES